ncbi:ATP-binding cassette domain-containing protein [Clostridioides difficile]|nr:ATP-binding cassette domain-containing protein [Clostridioides difficile]
MNDNIVEVKNINMNFYTKEGELEVLKDVNFNLKEGEILTLLGPSGSGKSTILNILTNLLKPTSGDIKITGNIGYMFQKDNLLEWRNIMDNITIGLEIQGKKDKKSLDRVADKVAILSKRPATIKNIYDIELNMDGTKTPLKTRKVPDFQKYFDILWKELDTHEA